MKLAKEELIVWGAYALCFAYFTKWWTLLAIPLSAVLGAAGGAQGISKIVRRLGCPLVVLGLAAIAQHSLIPLISVLPVFGVLSIGYGIPSFNGAGGTCDDEGSTLGRFVWYKVLRQPAYKVVEMETTADLIVRGICGLLTGLAMAALIPFGLTAWVLGTVWFTIAFPLIVITF